VLGNLSVHDVSGLVGLAAVQHPEVLRVLLVELLLALCARHTQVIDCASHQKQATTEGRPRAHTHTHVPIQSTLLQCIRCLTICDFLQTSEEIAEPIAKCPRQTKKTNKLISAERARSGRNEEVI
jgi:hypothetical protein